MQCPLAVNLLHQHKAFSTYVSWLIFHFVYRHPLKFTLDHATHNIRDKFETRDTKCVILISGNCKLHLTVQTNIKL